MTGIFPPVPFKYVSIFIFVVFSFTYNVVFNKNMQCTCKNQARDCFPFLILPAIPFMFVLLGTEKSFQTIYRHTCSWSCKCCKSCRFLCFKFMVSLVKAALVGLLWTVSVLIDGEWYVCCWPHSGRDPHLSCKDKTKITYEEQLIITDEKNASWFGGILVLIGILFVGGVLSLLENSKCCGRKPLFNDLIMEEGETVLDEVARKLIKEELTRKIQTEIEAGKWSKCLTVAEDLIEKGPTCLRQEGGTGGAPGRDGGGAPGGDGGEAVVGDGGGVPGRDGGGAPGGSQGNNIELRSISPREKHENTSRGESGENNPLMGGPD